MPTGDVPGSVFEVAVLPAMQKNGLNAVGVARAFDSDSALADVHVWLERAEVITADVPPDNPDLLYVLGLAHGMGRCPLILTHGFVALPFNLNALRCVEYGTRTPDELLRLRESLTRAVRVFLTASRAGNP
jgi:hypothetical protein